MDYRPRSPRDRDRGRHRHRSSSRSNRRHSSFNEYPPQRRGADRDGASAVGLKPISPDGIHFAHSVAGGDNTSPRPGNAVVAGGGGGHTLELSVEEQQMMRRTTPAGSEDNWIDSLRQCNSIQLGILLSIIALVPMYTAVIATSVAEGAAFSAARSRLLDEAEAIVNRIAVADGDLERSLLDLRAANDDALSTRGAAAAFIVLFVLAISAATVAVIRYCVAKPVTTLSVAMSNVKLEELIESEESSALGITSPRVPRDARAVPSRITEVARCEGAFQQLRGGLEAFACFVPRNVVNRIVSGEARARTLYVEERRVSIMFSDIEGFTSIAEKLSQAALVRLISVYMSRMCAIIERHGGVVTEILGDGILAFWNAAEDCDDHARRACEAAIEQQCDLPDLNKSLNQYSSYPPIRLRIGLHTGSVQAGNIGAPNRMKFGCVGDAVNLSSRLEGLCKMYVCKIIISGDTYEDARQAMVCRELDLVAVKGKSEGVKIYELIGRHSIESKTTRRAADKFTRAHAAFLDGDLKSARTLISEYVAAGGMSHHDGYQKKKKRGSKKNRGGDAAGGTGTGNSGTHKDVALDRFLDRLSTAESTLVHGKLPSNWNPITILESDFDVNAGTRDGFIVLGVVEHLRNHFLTDGSNKKHRLVRLSVAVSWAKRRAFHDKTQEEIDATPFGKHHLQRTGFLSTVKSEKKDPLEVVVDELHEALTYPAGLECGGTPETHPAIPGRFEFFGSADTFKAKDFKPGDVCKLKTRNNSCLLETASKYDPKAMNFSGEDVGEGWGDKLDKKKDQATAKFEGKALPGEDKEGVDEDEWD